MASVAGTGTTAVSSSTPKLKVNLSGTSRNCPKAAASWRTATRFTYQPLGANPVPDVRAKFVLGYRTVYELFVFDCFVTFITCHLIIH